MDHLDDQEQAAKVKAFWHEHGKQLLGAVCVGLVLSFGWRYWKHQQQRHAEQASRVYMTLKETKAGKHGINEKALAALVHTHPNSIYTSMAKLDEAKLAVASEDYTKAIASYKWVIKNAKNKGYQALAACRLARVYLNEKQPENALLTLNHVSVASFSGVVNLLKGRAYKQQGLDKQAADAFALAKRDIQHLPEWML